MSSKLANRIAACRTAEAVDEALAPTREAFEKMATFAHLDHIGTYETLNVRKCASDRCRRIVEVLRELEVKGAKP